MNVNQSEAEHIALNNENGMIITKSHFQLTTLLFLLASPVLTLATDLTVGETKRNDSVFAIHTQKHVLVRPYQQRTNGTQPLQSIKQRKIQEAQLEAYKRFLENRKYRSSASLPADTQRRRSEYIKQMEQRHSLMNNMMDERRKAAQEKREIMLRKMHQTSTTSAIAEKA